MNMNAVGRREGGEGAFVFRRMCSLSTLGQLHQFLEKNLEKPVVMLFHLVRDLLFRIAIVSYTNADNLLQK